MNTALLRLQAIAAEAFRHLRHPTWRGVAWFVAALPVLALLYVLILIPFTPSIGDVRKAKSEKPTLVLSSDGKELAMFKRANRDWVKLADISPHVIAALLATEDHRFFRHHGIDLKRTGAAAVRTLSGDRQGGSTLTQQLARNLYPEEVGRAPTITRKIKEAITALKIERVYTKNEILETYLNTVPFLYNAYGIEMAARTYFDKSARTLDVIESATLIGMLKGTSYYNPVLNPERAVERRNIVLAQMVRNDKLRPDQFEALKKRPMRIDFERQNEPLGPAPHFTQQLRRWLIEWADRNDYNIYADGLVVRTTIDSRLQALANRALARQADRLQNLSDSRAAWSGSKDQVQAFVRESPAYRAAREAGLTEAQALKQVMADTAAMQSLREEKTRLQAGFMAMDPRNGRVLAWVGSRDFTQDQFDHVQQARRQPGSTFKPFVYGAAFAQGISPDEMLIDQAVEIQLGPGDVWRPTDIDPPSGLPVSLRDGLAFSKNTITAQVMLKVGPARVAELARAMGVRQSKLEAVPSLALGTSPVTLKEMVAAYGTIANSGSYIEPVLVTQVEDRNGVVLERFQPSPLESALAAATAMTLLDVMRGVIDKGTGVAIRRQFGIQADVAGKTGTTQSNTDGWFVMLHPQMVAGAWVGFNDNRVTMGDAWGQGARSALPIVGEFFQQSLKAGIVDQRMRFAAPQQQPGVLDPLMGRVNDWLSSVFQSGPPPPPAPEPAPEVLAEPPAPIPPASVADPVPGLGFPQPREAAAVQVFPRSSEAPVIVEPERPAAPAGGVVDGVAPEPGRPRRTERVGEFSIGSPGMIQRPERRPSGEASRRRVPEAQEAPVVVLPSPSPPAVANPPAPVPAPENAAQ